MNTLHAPWRAAIIMLTVLAVIPASATGGSADRFDAAIQHAGRNTADAQRDVRDHPAELLRLTRIGPGMHVADMLAGDGYYSELLGQVVGAGGHVLMINNSSFDKWSDGDRQKRLADNRLPNVEYRVVDLDRMNFAAGSLDAIVPSKVYHDIYWVDMTGRQLAQVRYQRRARSAGAGPQARRCPAADRSLGKARAWQRGCVLAPSHRRSVCAP